MNLEETWQRYLDAINAQDLGAARQSLESLMQWLYDRVPYTDDPYADEDDGWFDKGGVKIRITRKLVRSAYAELRILLADRHR
jgi:hypothetical protein